MLNFWKNKKVFITGIDGFVGSNLAKELVNKKAQVFGLIKRKKQSLLYLERVDKRNVYIKIFDQGKGIDFKDSEKIFDRFYSDRQENIKNHTGLGLSIAREIIMHMDGQLVFNKSDKSEYSGACFLIILPIRNSSKL